MNWDRTRRDLEDGIRSVKWLGRFLAERTRVETSLAKVLFVAQRLRKSIDEKQLELGERVFELRDDRGAMDNATVRDLVDQIQALKGELDLCLARARELGGEEMVNLERDFHEETHRSSGTPTVSERMVEEAGKTAL